MYTTKQGWLAFNHFFLQKQRLNIVRLLNKWCHITYLYVLVSDRKQILKSKLVLKKHTRCYNIAKVEHCDHETKYKKTTFYFLQFFFFTNKCHVFHIVHVTCKTFQLSQNPIRVTLSLDAHLFISPRPVHRGSWCFKTSPVSEQCLDASDVDKRQ